MTNWKALCAELVKEIEDEYYGTSSHPDCLLRARTALAQPEPEIPSIMEILTLADEVEEEGLGQVDLVRRAVARWGRPAVEPAPVSERLPGPEDCDARGWCWYWHPDEECWEMVPQVTGTVDEWSHWLPHHALPLPTP